MANHPMHLGVNIDHVATLRQARGSRYPEPAQAALVAEQAGADSITVHLREDRRHIQDRDVYLLRECLGTAMNLEMAVTEEMLSIAEDVVPRDVCLVPEKREELTTEGGLDILARPADIAAACERLTTKGIQVSLFIDADEKQIDAAIASGAAAIEIHTGHYANAASLVEANVEREKIARMAQYALGKGLKVNAGHGLTTHNVVPIAAIPAITELNIGHALISRALFTGLEEAVREFKRLMIEARQTIS